MLNPLIIIYTATEYSNTIINTAKLSPKIDSTKSLSLILNERNRIIHMPVSNGIKCLVFLMILVLCPELQDGYWIMDIEGSRYNCS